MKKTITIESTLMFFMTITTVIALAQRPAAEMTEVSARQIDNSTLLNFTAMGCDGKVFLNWNVQEENEDGIFIIERSVEDTNRFYKIAVKTGIGVEIDLPLLYSVIDKDPVQGNSYYRIRKQYPDGRYYVSGIEMADMITEQEINVTRTNSIIGLHYQVNQYPGKSNIEPYRQRPFH